MKPKSISLKIFSILFYILRLGRKYLWRGHGTGQTFGSFPEVLAKPLMYHWTWSAFVFCFVLIGNFAWWLKLISIPKQRWKRTFWSTSNQELYLKLIYWENLEVWKAQSRWPLPSLDITEYQSYPKEQYSLRKKVHLYGNAFGSIAWGQTNKIIF